MCHAGPSNSHYALLELRIVGLPRWLNIFKHSKRTQERIRVTNRTKILLNIMLLHKSKVPVFRVVVRDVHEFVLLITPFHFEMPLFSTTIFAIHAKIFEVF